MPGIIAALTKNLVCAAGSVKRNVEVLHLVQERSQALQCPVTLQLFTHKVFICQKDMSLMVEVLEDTGKNMPLLDHRIDRYRAPDTAFMDTRAETALVILTPPAKLRCDYTVMPKQIRNCIKCGRREIFHRKVTCRSAGNLLTISVQVMNTRDLIPVGTISPVPDEGSEAQFAFFTTYYYLRIHLQNFTVAHCGQNIS